MSEQSINEILRKTFPLLEEVLTPSETIHMFRIVTSLPYPILSSCSYTATYNNKQSIQEHAVYIMGGDNTILAEVPQSTVTPSPSGSGGYIVIPTKALCHIILQNIDLDIAYVVTISANFRIDGSNKNLNYREVIIFEVNCATNVLRSNCMKTKEELRLRGLGKEPFHFN